MKRLSCKRVCRACNISSASFLARPVYSPITHCSYAHRYNTFTEQLITHTSVSRFCRIEKSHAKWKKILRLISDKLLFDILRRFFRIEINSAGIIKKLLIKIWNFFLKLGHDRHKINRSFAQISKIKTYIDGKINFERLFQKNGVLEKNSISSNFGVSGLTF
jgi:hypothetical protein